MTTSVWQKIEAFLRVDDAEGFRDLRPPADEGILDQLESHLGRRLPADVRRTYLLHDGQEGRSRGIFDGWEFLKAEYVIAEHRALSGLLASGAFEGASGSSVGPVKPLWWSDAWVPILSDGMGDYICTDLDPDQGGNYGQIVKFRHDSEFRYVVASGFDEWLSNFIDQLGQSR